MKKILACLISLLLLFQCCCGVFAAENLLSLSAGVNGDSLSVVLKSSFSFAAMSAEIQYDADKLEFESSAFDERLAGLNPLVNPSFSKNSVKISLMSVSDIEKGEICTVNFRVKNYASGNAEFLIAKSVIGDAEGNAVEVSVQNASAEVKSSAAAPASGGGSAKSAAAAKPAPTQETPSAQGAPAAQFENPFTDVAQNDWFYGAVVFAAEKQITSGVSDTLFDPNGRVTRAQFITMLCRAYGVSKMQGDNFSDCEDAWYTGYTAAAKQLGISNGTGENKFSPEKEITREETVTLIYNYLKLKGGVTAASAAAAFDDAADISDWAAEAVWYAAENKIVLGSSDNLFKPQNTTTRAELAQMFYNILNR